MTQARQNARSGLDMGKLRGMIDEILEEDPGAIKASIFRALLASAGDQARAAKYLDISPAYLTGLIDKLRIRTLIEERWPNKS